MKPAQLIAIAVLLIGRVLPAGATDAVKGTVSTFTSYYGTEEACVRMPPVPGGVYDKGDIVEEMRLCSLDFYSEDIALCPKIWSTTASVVLYDIAGSRFDGERTRFQEVICAGGKIAEYVANDDLARLIFTMNEEGTSASFSPAPLLYYHLSRYFDMTTKVPVAVWRSIDKKVLLGEVAETGAVLTEGSELASQNHAAWQALVDAINDPESYGGGKGYGGPEDLFTSDGASLYGALLDGTDLPFGLVMNGSFLPGQSMSYRYLALQATPAFQALVSAKPLEGAIAAGLRDGLGDLRGEPGGAEGITAEQMAFWMREMSEILLLDYILAQQDRPGNIDRKLYYYWVENGKVERRKADGRTPGKDGIPETAVPILRSRINDNNAAGRVEYDNHTMRYKLLERVRHFDAKIYRKLMKLDDDFRSNGPIHTWLTESFGLDAETAGMIVNNTSRAADMLLFACQNGELQFDLNPNRYFLNHDATPDPQRCIPGGD